MAGSHPVYMGSSISKHVLSFRTEIHRPSPSRVVGRGFWGGGGCSPKVFENPVRANRSGVDGHCPPHKGKFEDPPTRVQFCSVLSPRIAPMEHCPSEMKSTWRSDSSTGFPKARANYYMMSRKSRNPSSVRTLSPVENNQNLREIVWPCPRPLCHFQGLSLGIAEQWPFCHVHNFHVRHQLA